MKRWKTSGWYLSGLLLSTALSPALADGDERLMPAAVPKAYLAECASCHTAYAPALLPRESWRRIMAGLDRHYGSDASLDPATVAQLSRWLDQHAGSGKRAREAPPEDRITRAAWFERKHRQIPAAVWRLPSVRSAAQCAACHSGAERGDFEDEGLQRPAGLSPAQARAWQD